MYNSALFDCLKAISQEEWRPLRRDLKKILSMDGDVWILFDHIYGCRDKLDHKSLNLEIVRSRLFHKKSRKAIGNIMSDLKSTIIDLWAIEEFRREPREYRAYMLQALNRRGLFMLVDKVTESKENQQTFDSETDLWTEYYKFRQNFNKFFSLHPLKNDVSIGKQILLDLTVSLRHFYSYAAKFISIEMSNRQELYEEDWEEQIDLNKYYEREYANDELYGHLTLLEAVFRHGRIEDIEKLKSVLFDANNNYGERLNLAFYIHIRKALSRKWRNKDLTAVDNIIDVMDEAYKKNLVRYNKSLPLSTFINDVSLLCALGKIDEAREFAKEFQIKLYEAERKSGKIIVETIIDFTCGQHHKVIEYLNNPLRRFSDLNARVMTYVLRSSYHLAEDDPTEVLDQIRNYSLYLKRNKNRISQGTLEGQLNFLKVLTFLCTHRDVAEIQAFLSQKINIYHRKWIGEQIKMY